MHHTGYAASHPTLRPATALVESISLQDTVYLLRGELGNLRNWNSWLCDGNKRSGNRGPSTLHGHTLRPCARVNGAPRYNLDDVYAFIRAIQAAVPSARPAPVVTEVLRIVPGRLWRLNDFKDGVATIH